MSQYLNDQYPVSALGSSLAPAVLQHCRNTNIPFEMVAPVALGCAAGAVQNLVNIIRPGLAPSPVSMSVLVVAGSGEGKDVAAAPFIKPFHTFQERSNEANAEHAQRHELDAMTWKAEHDVLLGELKQLMRQGEAIDTVRARLSAHLSLRSKPPRAPKIIFDDATPSAVKMSLCTNWPSALVYSMEATSIFNGRLMGDFGFWNAAWGGAPIHLDRISSGNVSVAAPRLSLVLGIQPEPLERFLRRRGTEAHDSGLLARFLVTCPRSTKGFRLIDVNPKTTDHLDAYTRQFAELLNESAKISGGTDGERMSLPFSANAQACFIDIYNMLQELMRPYASFHQVAAQAAKLAEQVARVAGVLHVVDGFEGPIREDTLRRAEMIVRWHSIQYLQAFSTTTPQAQDAQDAQELEAILAHHRFKGHHLVRRSDLIFMCHSSWKKARLERALRISVGWGRVCIENWERTSFVRLADSPPPPRKLRAEVKTLPRAVHGAAESSAKLK